MERLAEARFDQLEDELGEPIPTYPDALAGRRLLVRVEAPLSPWYRLTMNWGDEDGAGLVLAKRDPHKGVEWFLTPWTPIGLDDLAGLHGFASGDWECGDLRLEYHPTFVRFLACGRLCGWLFSSSFGHTIKDFLRDVERARARVDKALATPSGRFVRRRELPMCLGLELVLLQNRDGDYFARLLDPRVQPKRYVSPLLPIERWSLEAFAAGKDHGVSLENGYRIAMERNTVTVMSGGELVTWVNATRFAEVVWAFLCDVDGTPTRPRPGTVDAIWYAEPRRRPTETRTEDPNGDRIYPEVAWGDGGVTIARYLPGRAEEARRVVRISGATVADAEAKYWWLVRELRKDWESDTRGWLHRVDVPLSSARVIQKLAQAGLTTQGLEPLGMVLYPLSFGGQGSFP